MRLIILAAGMAKRMGSLTAERPKCLVAFSDGTSILSRLVSSAAAVPQVDELLLVGGYRVAELEEAVTEFQRSLRAHVVYNPFYSRAGPLVSLWVAHPWMMDVDFLVCNGDTVYSPGALAALAGAGEGICLGVSRPPGPIAADAVKVVLNPQGGVARVGKDVQPAQAQYISAGLLAVRGEAMRLAFREALCTMMRSGHNLRRRTIWHSVFNYLVRSGIAVDVGALGADEWQEIDTVADLQNAGPFRHAPGAAGERRGWLA